MSTLTFICIIIGLICVWAIVTGKWKSISVLFNGIMEVFIQDLAKTPDGANAVYTDLINKQTENLSNIKNIYSEIVGESEILARETKEMENRSMKIEAQLKSSAARSDFNSESPELILLAEEKFSLDDNIESNKKAILQINTEIIRIKDTMQTSEANIIKLKNERTTLINELKRNGRIAKVYSAVSNISVDNSSNNLITSVKEGVRESSAKSIGSRIVHDNSIEVKLEKAHKQAVSTAASDYLKSLKK